MSKEKENTVQQTEKKKAVKARTIPKAKKELPVEPVIEKNTADCLRVLSKYVMEKDKNKIIDNLILFYANRVNLSSYDVRVILKKLREV